MHKKKTIIVISNEPWGDVWYSKHHYAYELSKSNTVYFINPSKKWQLKNIFSFQVKEKKIYENLTIVQYANNFPLIFFNSFFLFINDFINSLKLSFSIVNKTTNPIIIWQFDPFRFVNIFLKHKRIYHVVDPYSAFQTDTYIAKKADLIVSISKLYVERYKRLNNNVIFIPHGISKEDFILKETFVKDNKNKYGRFILFVGTINQDVDMQLLLGIAKKITNTLLLIGPQMLHKEEDLKLFNQLLSLKNIIYTGPLHAQTLKNYIAAASVCIIPYKMLLTNRTQTLKVWNYITQKKPIISPMLNDLLDVNNKIIFMANTHAEFIEFVNKGLNNELSYDFSTAEYLIENNLYSKHITKIFNHL